MTTHAIVSSGRPFGLLGADRRPIGSVRAPVEAARVAQVMIVAVATP